MADIRLPLAIIDRMISESQRTARINDLEVDDKMALRMKEFYPSFEQLVQEGKKGVIKGFRFTHHGDLYKTAQPSTDFVSHYAPGPGTESMYTRIDEVHSGSLYDPIPYGGNMELLEGLHYQQDGVVYVCTRATGTPVHHPLAQLVGLYVQVAREE